MPPHHLFFERSKEIRELFRNAQKKLGAALGLTSYAACSGAMVSKEIPHGRRGSPRGSPSPRLGGCTWIGHLAEAAEAHATG